jgi:hypothetical protein
MAKYRKIDPRIWNDAKFMALSDNGKLTFLFLLTHPHMTALGAMRATIPGLAAELGWSEEAFREAFQEVLAKGIVEHDPKASFLWLPNFIKFNPPESPNVVKAWSSSLDLLPECVMKMQCLHKAKVFAEGMSKGFGEALPKGFAEDYALSGTGARTGARTGAGILSPKGESGPDPRLQPNQESATSPSKKLSIVVRTSPRALFDAWNEIVAGSGLLLAKEFTKGREQKSRARLKEREVEEWREIFKLCASTPFLQGDNDRKWRVDFDWIIKNGDNGAKVLEGKYSTAGKEQGKGNRYGMFAGV